MTMTDSDDVGKLFVGGLSWETTQNALLSYFSRFGEVVDCVVMKNNETGRSRGFGFVTFKDPNCVAAVLHAKPHELNGRTIDAKECTPRSMQKGKRTGSSSSSQAKIFLGGLPPDVTEAAVRNAMSKFGNVTQVLIMFDSETKKCRGFGFLSFDSEESIERACAEHFVNINGKQIECKRAQPREEYNNRRNSGQPNMYGNSGNDFPRSSFGAMNTSDYQNNWNTPSPPSYAKLPSKSVLQSLPYKGNSYGGYQNTGGGASNYYSTSTPYSSMPESQYSMSSSYSNYGAQSTSVPSVPTYNYPQPPANSYSSSTSYSDTSSYPGANTQTPALGGGSYGGNAYTQDSSYAPAKAHGGLSSKMPTAGGMGYHPYRR